MWVSQIGCMHIFSVNCESCCRPQWNGCFFRCRCFSSHHCIVAGRLHRGRQFVHSQRSFEEHPNCAKNCDSLKNIWTPAKKLMWGGRQTCYFVSWKDDRMRSTTLIENWSHKILKFKMNFNRKIKLLMYLNWKSKKNKSLDMSYLKHSLQHTTAECLFVKIR
jgi:hypothetical protein